MLGIGIGWKETGTGRSTRGNRTLISAFRDLDSRKVRTPGFLHAGTPKLRLEKLSSLIVWFFSRQRKGLALLKSSWTSEMEDPLYSVDLALIICNENAFKDGLLFWYEKLKLYKEVLSCYKQALDHEGLIACCKKLGDSSQGGDPSLWGDLLKLGILGKIALRKWKRSWPTLRRRMFCLPSLCYIHYQKTHAWCSRLSRITLLANLSKNQSLLKMLENLWTSTRLVIQLWYLLQRFLSVAILSTFESIYAKELVLRIAWFGANVI